MAKKHEDEGSKITSDKSDVLALLKANSARKGGRRLKDRSYTIKKEWSPEELGACRLSPQAITCVGVILDIEGDVVTEQELFNTFDAAAEQFEGSKQTPWEVFNYYRAKIVDAGFLVEVIK